MVRSQLELNSKKMFKKARTFWHVWEIKISEQTPPPSSLTKASWSGANSITHSPFWLVSSHFHEGLISPIKAMLLHASVNNCLMYLTHLLPKSPGWHTHWIFLVLLNNSHFNMIHSFTLLWGKSPQLHWCFIFVFSCYDLDIHSCNNFRFVDWQW